MMKQVEISEPGGPEVLVLREAEIAEPKPFEVLIKVVAAGVNRPDIVQRQGNYKPPEGASEIPGLEVSGIITQVGHDVRGYNVGDKVCALLTGGGYAEYCCAPVSQILPIPDGISIADASCIPGVSMFLGDQTPSVTTENPNEIESWCIPVQYFVRGYALGQPLASDTIA